MLPKRLLLVSFVAMLVLSCSVPAVTQAPPSAQPVGLNIPKISAGYFPLQKGASWVYQGRVKWTKTNSAGVMEEEITWKMEVKQVHHRNDIVGYEMFGAPWDLAWYEAGKEPSKYGIIQAQGKFYRVSLDTLLRLLNEADDLAGLVSENDIILDTPLVSGKKFCDQASLARSDNMYCWTVGEGAPFDATALQGVDLSMELREYPITNRTLPDISTLYFVPDVGISRYSYHHNGTVSDVDVRLIEYYPGK